MVSNTIGALKAIYTALGGNSSTVATKNTIPDMLTAIATQLTAVGVTDNLLPAVSAYTISYPPTRRRWKLQIPQ